MQRSVSENLIIPFIKKNKWLSLIALLLLLGVLLMSLPEQGGGAHSDEESRVAELCCGVRGVGRCTVMLNIKEGEVISAAVLCEGADSPSVESQVKELISSLYGIGYNRISVLKISE